MSVSTSGFVRGTPDGVVLAFLPVFWVITGRKPSGLGSKVAMVELLFISHST